MAPIIHRPRAVTPEIISAEVNEVLAYVGAIWSRRRDRNNFSSAPNIENQVLDCLAKTFLRVASQHVDDAKPLILSLDSPALREYAHGRLLSKIVEHALLLADVATPGLRLEAAALHANRAWIEQAGDPSLRRPFDLLPDTVQEGNTLSIESPILAENSRAIQQILSLISRRLAQPFGENEGESPPAILPLLSSTFQHVRFRYMDAISVVGITPQMLINPWRHLPILWHEAAAHGVYLARRNGEIKKWIKQLNKDDVDVLKKLFEVSLIEDTTVGITFNGDGPTECPYRIEHCNKLDEELQALLNIEYPDISDESEHGSSDKDGWIKEWLIDWMGEFYEDLFGVDALGETMILSLALALVRNYRRLDIGDSAHPPANLRLAVAIYFLQLLRGAEDGVDADNDALPGVDAALLENLNKLLAPNDDSALELLGCTDLASAANAVKIDRLKVEHKQLLATARHIAGIFVQLSDPAIANGETAWKPVALDSIEADIAAKIRENYDEWGASTFLLEPEAQVGLPPTLVNNLPKPTLPASICEDVSSQDDTHRSGIQRFREEVRTKMAENFERLKKEMATENPPEQRVNEAKLAALLRFDFAEVDAAVHAGSAGTGKKKKPTSDTTLD